MANDDLLAYLFGDPAVAECLSDSARVQAMLDVEAALAEAEAALHVIPARTGARVREAAEADLYDLAAIASEAAAAGNLAIPLVKQLTARVAAADPEASRFVHWGATSQDVIDTGLLLQLRAAVTLVAGHLDRAAEAAATLARRYAEAPMPGRTWLQQGPPTTFGLKAAGWLDALDRVNAQIQGALTNALVLQFGGATGTLAALGDRGAAVARDLAARLELALPDVPWHAHRDRLAALGCALGVAAGTLGKIGRDLALLAQTEVREAFERPSDGTGGSSTMPHKQNPVGTSVVLAAAARVPGLVATLLTAMPQEHERGLGGWQAEWETLPELVRVVAGAARATADALAQLHVDPERMRANLEATRGVSLSEAVSMKLASRIGRPEAHRIVAAASKQALDEHRELAEVLAEDPSAARVLTREEIDEALSPEGYLGSSAAFIDQVLARHRART